MYKYLLLFLIVFVVVSQIKIDLNTSLVNWKVSREISNNELVGNPYARQGYAMKHYDHVPVSTRKKLLRH